MEDDQDLEDQQSSGALEQESLVGGHRTMLVQTPAPSSATNIRWCRLLLVLSVVANAVLLVWSLTRTTLVAAPNTAVDCHDDDPSNGNAQALSALGIPTSPPHERLHVSGNEKSLKGGDVLVDQNPRWIGMLHRNCYTGEPDAADPFFDFYASFHFRWHNAWWGGPDYGPAKGLTAGHPLVVKTFNAADLSTYGPSMGEDGRLTLFIVAGMLQPGQSREDYDADVLPETFTESIQLLNSALLLSSTKLELVIATDAWGQELYRELFAEVTRTKHPVEVSLMRVNETWTSALARDLNYDLKTHHSGIWGTLKMFAHRLPVFASRSRPIVVVDTDMIFMTDPAGILVEFPSASDKWMLKMPINSGAMMYKQGSASMCSCVVIQNLAQLHANDPYPDQFREAMQIQANKDGAWTKNGRFTPPHGDQGLYWAMLSEDDTNNVEEDDRFE